MKKYILPGFLILSLVYVCILVFRQDKLNVLIENQEYQNYISEYKKTIDKEILEIIDRNEEYSAYDLNYNSGRRGGTTGNFEGPQVHLKAIKFHNEYLNKADERLIHFDGVYAHFDPDHQCFGLPDVEISVQDVRMYDHRSAVAKFLNFDTKSEPQPYKVYRKRIQSDSLGLTTRYLVMQLWLTEFQININIRPDQGCSKGISKEEKNSLEYPGYWYGSDLPKKKLSDLSKENSGSGDNRYGNLHFILEVIPDNSPIYYKSGNERTQKADFAIAAIYCNEAVIGNEPDVQRISTNIHSGKVIFLKQNLEDNSTQIDSLGFTESIEGNADKIMNYKASNSDFIWNKPYYIDISFNNLGTWRSGLFKQNQFHDQVGFKFLMPLFVVGTWDVIAPQEILPEWAPPEPFVKKFSLRNILPFGDMGFGGKLVSIVLLIGLLLVGFTILFPGIIGFLK
jgi:hypothetical protein